MKNNTKIRLHLSKQLFESLTKQVLAEGKVNDGYSEAVKQPKQAKEIKAQKAAPEVKSTDKMKKKMEEKMSSKEKMAKGLYKETDMEEGTQGSKENIKAGAKVHPHGQPEKVMTVVSPDGGFGGKVQVKDEKGGTYSFEAEDLELVEGDLNEISGAMDLLQQSAPIWGTALGIAGTWLAAWLTKVKEVEGDDTRTPEEKAKAKEKLQQDLVRQMNRSKGF